MRKIWLINKMFHLVNHWKEVNLNFYFPSFTKMASKYIKNETIKMLEILKIMDE